MENVVDSLIEVRIGEAEDFLKIKETLTRIGVASRREKKLYQSCHILHKRGKYYIVHFKELFALDGKAYNFSEEDKGRRNSIISLLEQWNLIKVVEPSQMEHPRTPMSQIKIIQHKDKSNWTLESKYSIGKKR